MTEAGTEKQVGKRIAQLRTERGWSQQKLADQMKALGGRYANWRQGMIDKTERGARPLRVNEMFDMAGVLGVPPEVLLAFDVDAAVLDEEIMATEALLKEAEQDHANAARHLQMQRDKQAQQLEWLDVAERDTALRATRHRATLEVLYRMRANLSKKTEG